MEAEEDKIFESKTGRRSTSPMARKRPASPSNIFDEDECDEEVAQLEQQQTKTSKKDSADNEDEHESDSNQFDMMVHPLDYFDPNLNTAADEVGSSLKSKVMKRINKANKDMGKEYFTYRNKKVAARKLEELGECKKKCKTKLSLEQQKELFKNYWNLGEYNKRRQYISTLIEVKNKKTEIRFKAPNPRNRKYVNCYHVEIKGQKIDVCKACFLKIFGETDQFVKTIAHLKVSQGGLITEDRRGKHSPVHKLSTEKRSEVLQHIESFPKYCSHHTSQLYFQRGLSISALYLMYIEKYSDPVSESKYNELFRAMNLKFQKPQLNRCKSCDYFKSHETNVTEPNEKAFLLMQQKDHHADAEFAYESKSSDKNLAKHDVEIKMLSFDLQQSLPTPYLRTSFFYYKRPLWTFNLTVHDGATNLANCFVWNETLAERGPSEIGSCLYKLLLDLPRTVKRVILYSDPCARQNRNSCISAMFEEVMEDHPSIEVIDHKFLVAGHTQLDCDVIHEQIDKKKKNFFGNIHHPHDWANLIAATNKNYLVNEMKQEEFYDFDLLLKNKYTWRSTNIIGEEFEWKDVRWVRYEKSKLGILQYKLSLRSEDSFKFLNISKISTSHIELVAKYTSPLTVPLNKKRDLLNMLPFVNKQFHNFYKSIKAGGECQVEIDSDLDEEESV